MVFGAQYVQCRMLSMPRYEAKSWKSPGYRISSVTFASYVATDPFSWQVHRNTANDSALHFDRNTANDSALHFECIFSVSVVSVDKDSNTVNVHHYYCCICRIVGVQAWALASQHTVDKYKS